MSKDRWNKLDEIASSMPESMQVDQATGAAVWTASTEIVDLGYQACNLLKLKRQMDGERETFREKAAKRYLKRSKSNSRKMFALRLALPVI